MTIEMRKHENLARRGLRFGFRRRDRLGLVAHPPRQRLQDQLLCLRLIEIARTQVAAGGKRQMASNRAFKARVECELRIKPVSPQSFSPHRETSAAPFPCLLPLGGDAERLTDAGSGR